MRKILITGGAGFIGSYLAEKLIKDKDNYVVVVDNFSTGSPEKLPQLEQSNWRFIKCDVNDYRDISEVMLSYNFDFVFHYAATVGVQRTQDHPVWVLQDLHGIEHILRLSKSSGVKRVYFSSSSEVYGEPVELPQHEHTTPLNSRIPYAVVKNVGESYLRSYQKEFGLEFTIFRFFNTYGPKQSIDFVMSRFINFALKNQDITIYGDGSQRRTFCFIDDNIDATTNALYQNKIINDVVNIGDDRSISILELANKIIEVTGSSSKIVHVPELEEGDMKRRLPDISKMKTLLNRELKPIEYGIKQIIDNPSFILL